MTTIRAGRVSTVPPLAIDLPRQTQAVQFVLAPRAGHRQPPIARPPVHPQRLERREHLLRVADLVVPPGGELLGLILLLEGDVVARDQRLAGRVDESQRDPIFARCERGQTTMSSYLELHELRRCGPP